MATKLSICNAALIKLGQEPIVALTDNSKRAKLVDTNYDRVKRKLLRRHSWNFAKRRVELTATGITPEFGYTHEFDLPNDFIRLLEIEKTGYEHIVEDGKILYNGGETLKIIYVYNADEDLFDSLFEDLMAASLSDELAYSLTQNENLKQRIMAELDMLLGETRSINAQSRGTPQDIEADDLLIARR